MPRARFIYTAEAEEKKYSKLFRTAGGNCSEKIYFSLPPAFFTHFFPSPRNAGVIEFFNYFTGKVLYFFYLFSYIIMYKV